jgi:hypothetical protein
MNDIGHLHSIKSGPGNCNQANPVSFCKTYMAMAETIVDPRLLRSGLKLKILKQMSVIHTGELTSHEKRSFEFVPLTYTLVTKPLCTLLQPAS